MDAVGAVKQSGGSTGGGERGGVTKAVVTAPGVLIEFFKEDGGSVAGEVFEPFGFEGAEIVFIRGHHALGFALVGVGDERALRLGVEQAGVGVGQAAGELAVYVDKEIVVGPDEAVDGVAVGGDAVERGLDKKVAGDLLFEEDGVDLVVIELVGEATVGAGEGRVDGLVDERAEIRALHGIAGGVGRTAALALVDE